MLNILRHFSGRLQLNLPKVLKQLNKDGDFKGREKGCFGDVIVEQLFGS